MNFKANYVLVPLSSGANEFPVTGGTNSMHQVYCIADGSVTITAEGGGQATFALTANEKVDIVTRSINVVGGTFVAFRAMNNSQSII